MNSPRFYTCMMGKLMIKCHTLSLETVINSKVICGMKVRVTDADEIYLNGMKKVSGGKGTIDSILPWPTNLDLILIYFECVCKIFEKYCVSFRLDKCELLKYRAEYVDHDLIPTRNVTEKYNFNIINGWKLPTSRQGLHSFIVLINFYHNYAPQFDVRIKPLQKFYHDYFRKDIPLMAWSPDLIKLFLDIKKCITSSPILARFDPKKPVFLKTDWSAEVMTWTLMQPADDEESNKTAKKLVTTGEWNFDLE